MTSRLIKCPKCHLPTDPEKLSGDQCVYCGMREDRMKPAAASLERGSLAPFELSQTWEGDGTGGVMFNMPSGGAVFVSRWTDRGEPDHATPEDFADAEFIVAAVKEKLEREGARP